MHTQSFGGVKMNSVAPLLAFSWPKFSHLVFFVHLFKTYVSVQLFICLIKSSHMPRSMTGLLYGTFWLYLGGVFYFCSFPGAHIDL